VHARRITYAQKTLFYRVHKLSAIHKVFALKGFLLSRLLLTTCGRCYARFWHGFCTRCTLLSTTKSLLYKPPFPLFFIKQFPPFFKPMRTQRLWLIFFAYRTCRSRMSCNVPMNSIVCISVMSLTSLSTFFSSAERVLSIITVSVSSVVM